jgi:hypothetical protein
MATTNRAVQIAAGLINSAASPSIGVGSVGQSFAFTEGHTCTSGYVDVGASSTPLNVSLAGDYGYLLVVNNSIQDVSLLVGATAMGKLPAATAAGQVGGVALIPVSSGVIVNATVPATTGQVWVAAIRCVANA